MYPYEHQLLINTAISDSSSFSFDVDDNPERWPWQNLPAYHPALAGKISFFTGFKCGEDLFEMPSGTASAVTSLSWENSGACLSGTQAPAGKVSCKQVENRFHYNTYLYDSAGTTQQNILAQGVAFQQRDFDGWRRKMKQAIQSVDAMRPVDFGFAEPASVAVASSAEVLISPLHENKNGLACYGLLDKHSGFAPGHPWHSGTGDHVNAAHQLDAAWQMAHLIGRTQGWLAAGTQLICTAGEASFKNYIELGAPFELRLKGWRPEDQGWRLSLALSQGGKPAAIIRLNLLAQ
ncbi:MAG: AfsA-related hotdog domain-containing protein [Salinisphaeraceae bacterium]|nr:AfsA-related hotdog domain-containing protein [Salinisphaeraceae bacterium]